MTARAIDRVDVAPLREAFLASGLTQSEVCRRLGWYCTRRSRSVGNQADIARLKRALGMQASRGYFSVTIGYDLAARIADAIGIDPVDAGL